MDGYHHDISNSLKDMLQLKLINLAMTAIHAPDSGDSYVFVVIYLWLMYFQNTPYIFKFSLHLIHIYGF